MEIGKWKLRIALGAFWLFSSAVILQAGTIMMAPLTALQALIFLWLRNKLDLVARFPGFIALFWLASLFTAYQAVLFLPVVLFIFLKALSPRRAFAYVFLPIALLALYIFSNPLALASFLIHGAKEFDQALSEKFLSTVHLWIIGGSLIGSILGTIGILRSKQFSLLGSFVLVFLYILLAQHDYYAILFTPLFVAGITEGWRGRRVASFSIVLLIGCAIYFVSSSFPSALLVSARETMKMIRASVREGEILISGPFGHEWQYESRVPIHRYRLELMTSASAAICLQPCAGIVSVPGWERKQQAPVEVWIRK